MARSVPQPAKTGLLGTTRPPDTAVSSAWSLGVEGRGAGAPRAVAADESQYGVRLNCVSPSTVEGPWLQRLDVTSDEARNTVTSSAMMPACDHSAHRGGVNNPDPLVVR